MEPITDKLYLITVPTPFIVGPVNVYLYKGEALTLIDTGPKTSEAWNALKAGLADTGVTIRDIERAILTHHHIDHSGLLQRIVEESDCVTYAHPNAVLESRLGDGEEGDVERKAFYIALQAELGVPEPERYQSMEHWDDYKYMIDHYEIDHVLRDEATAGPFQVFHVPGHSATDMLIVDEAEGFSFVGDHLLETFNPNPLMRRPAPGRQRARALVEYQASLHRSRELPLGRCCPGHGAPFDDYVSVANGILEQHEVKNKRLLKRIGPEGITPYQATKMLYPRLKLPNLYLGLSVAVGQLELLEERGMMRSEARDGVRWYLPVEETI
jgi:glyoxylase-like metal-dependent hydrolase (beta-lactamase superfamily II)